VHVMRANRSFGRRECDYKPMQLIGKCVAYIATRAKCHDSARVHFDKVDDGEWMSFIHSARSRVDVVRYQTAGKRGCEGGGLIAEDSNPQLFDGRLTADLVFISL